MNRKDIISRLKWIEGYYDYGSAPPLEYWGKDALRKLIEELEKEEEEEK